MRKRKSNAPVNDVRPPKKCILPFINMLRLSHGVAPQFATMCILVQIVCAVNPSFPPTAEESGLQVGKVFRYNGRLYGTLLWSSNNNGLAFSPQAKAKNAASGFFTADGSTQNWYNGSIIHLTRYETDVHVRLMPLGWDPVNGHASGDATFKAENCAKSSTTPYVERNFPEGSLMWFFTKFSNPSKPSTQLANSGFVHPDTGQQADFENLKLSDAEITEVFGTQHTFGRGTFTWRQFTSNAFQSNDQHYFQNQQKYFSGSLPDRDVLIDGNNYYYQDAQWDDDFDYNFTKATENDGRWISAVHSDTSMFSCKGLHGDSVNSIVPVEIITDDTTDFHTFQLPTGTQVAVQSSISTTQPLTTTQHGNIKRAYQNTLMQTYPSTSSWLVSMTESSQRRVAHFDDALTREKVTNAFKRHMANAGQQEH